MRFLRRITPPRTGTAVPGREWLLQKNTWILWAENGRIAVDLFANSEEHHFDAVLMDIRRPVMDGLTATRELRKLSHPDAKKIPIIALTANAFEEDVRQCLDAGMNAHLSKPVDLALLIKTMSRLLAGK